MRPAPVCARRGAFDRGGRLVCCDLSSDRRAHATRDPLTPKARSSLAELAFVCRFSGIVAQTAYKAAQAGPFSLTFTPQPEFDVSVEASEKHAIKT